MICNTFNLSFYIDDLYLTALYDLFPLVKNQGHNQNDHIDFSLEIINDRYDPGRYSLNYQQIENKNGVLLYNLLSMKFMFFISISNIHLPYLLSSIFVDIINIAGFKFDLFFLHSASVSVNSEVILIPGKQGRGKTTLSKHLQNSEVLNDDLSLIQFYKNRFYVYKIPNLLELNLKQPFLWQGPYPLKKIVFIRRYKNSSLKRLSKFEAASCFLQEMENEILMVEKTEAGRSQLNLIDKMVESANCYEISYTPGADFHILSALELKD